MQQWDDVMEDWEHDVSPEGGRRSSSRRSGSRNSRRLSYGEGTRDSIPSVAISFEAANFYPHARASFEVPEAQINPLQQRSSITQRRESLNILMPTVLSSTQDILLPDNSENVLVPPEMQTILIPQDPPHLRGAFSPGAQAGRRSSIDLEDPESLRVPRPPTVQFANVPDFDKDKVFSLPEQPKPEPPKVMLTNRGGQRGQATKSKEDEQRKMISRSCISTTS